MTTTIRNKRLVSAVQSHHAISHNLADLIASWGATTLLVGLLSGVGYIFYLLLLKELS